MRKELTDLGAREARTAKEVDEIIAQPGVVMLVVNSVCGCAAGKARPGIAKALEHANRPDAVGTVFAGADLEATEHARSYLTGFPPSSPSIALLRGGRLAVLGPRGLARVFVVDSAGGTTPVTTTSPADTALVEEAIAYYEGADHLYRRGDYRFAAARAAGRVARW